MPSNGAVLSCLSHRSPSNVRRFGTPRWYRQFRLWSHSTLSTSGLTVYASITIKDVPAEPLYGFQISGVPSA